MLTRRNAGYITVKGVLQMLAKDSYVVYGANGVCRITDIRRERLCGTKQKYYILTPVDNSSAIICVPVDNEKLVSKMRRIVSRSEITELIENLDGSQLKWIQNSRERNEQYDDILNRAEHSELLTLIYSIDNRRTELAKANKKLCAADESTLKKAKKMINEEFSIALSIAEEDVQDFISEHINNPADASG